MVSLPILGMVAILAGPLQFIPFLRNRYRGWHRTQGEIYLVAVLIGSLTGLYLAIFDNLLIKQEMLFGTGIAGLSVAWFLTTGMAFWAIKNGNIGLHADWMIKSYVVTTGFTTFRLLARLLSDFTPLNPADISGIATWAYWSVPLLMTDVMLQIKRITDSSIKRPSVSDYKVSEQAI